MRGRRMASVLAIVGFVAGLSGAGPEDERYSPVAPPLAIHVALRSSLKTVRDWVEDRDFASTSGDAQGLAALEANKVFQVLDGKQRDMALVSRRPAESAVNFRGKERRFPGIPIAELTRDQKDAVQKVLLSLLDPYRKEDKDEVQACLSKQGGLDKCSLAFYKDGDLGDDGEWDNWRLEGPAFVWYFRGTPHVYIWINVADDPSVKIGASG